MSYKNLEIWKLAREVSIDIHKMTLSLPKIELFEEGAQIRKSSKPCRSTIVEGYGRRYYKAEFIKFIIYSLASNLETTDHLETLHETGSLTDEREFNELHSRLEHLSKKLTNFLHSIERQHGRPQSNEVQEPYLEYLRGLTS
jgi:four helix bundle protein